MGFSVLICLILWGCETAKEAADSFLDCDGNATQRCLCSNGAVGVQICDPVMQQWNACICEPQCVPSVEVCGDSEDNDCDGLVDENGPRLYYDSDSDGVGSSLNQYYKDEATLDTEYSCDTVPPGYVPYLDDCNDLDPNLWSKCDQSVDSDGDGYGKNCDLGEDCDDNPLTGGICYNALECTTYFFDFDGDGYGADTDVRSICNDAEEQYFANLADSNGDCNDSDAEASPEYDSDSEKCDGVDNDCNPETLDGIAECPDVGCNAITQACWIACNPLNEQCYESGYVCNHHCNGDCYNWYSSPGSVFEYDTNSVPPELIVDTEGDSSANGGEWASRLKITIPADQIDVTVQSFPVFVNAANLSPYFRYILLQNSNGADVRVTTADGTTVLPSEVVVPTADFSQASVYFLANLLSSSVDNIFYIYFDNEFADPLFNSDEVWPNYSGVWHFDSTVTSDSLQDEDVVAAKGVPGVSMNAANDDDAVGGQSLAFSESNAVVEFSQDEYELDLSGDFTVSAWINPTDLTENTIMSRGNDQLTNGFSLKIDEDL
ncbi:MAG: hypothetical protein JXX29_22920 [Deltaproteobacteria bacterium]|nr:hypothetical protein [Deltaproteobacteria bacterium]MBN2674552.1 hypothetical protein [Deltaproteobacteria bacterium]